MRRALLACALLLAGCGGDGVATSTAQESGNTSDPFVVSDLRCGSDERGAVAEGTLENISESTWAAEIVVEWRDVDGNYYAGAVERVPDLAPTDTASWVAEPNTPEALRGTCHVADVVKVMPGGEATAFPTNGSPTSVPAPKEATQTTFPVPPDGN